MNPKFRFAALAAIALAMSHGAFAAGVSAADKDFMTKAAGGGIYEVEVAKLATSRATSASVKGYAEMLVNDHTKANEELKGIASAKGVALPSDMPADKKKDMDKLAKSKNFDKDFISQVGKKAHDADIKLFKQGAKSKDADVKAFAEKTLPVIQEHRKAANTLNKGGGHDMPG